MRYVTRHRKVRDGWLDDDPLIPNLDVPEHEEVFTGILDSRGHEIYRQPIPIGFGRDKER